MIEVATLSCGARLVTETMSDARSVAIGAWVGTGSRDESDSRAGASHFMEHLLFKGTPTWTAAEIAEAVDEVGGDMNAFTTKEYTAFYIRLLSENVALGLEVLSAIMTDPALRGEDVDAERQVILDEILMHADEAADLAAERCTGALFPRHPLGREVLGTASSVSELDTDEIRRFFDLHYRTNNLVLAAAGDIDHEQLASELDRRFSGQRRGLHADAHAPRLCSRGDRRHPPTDGAGPHGARHARTRSPLGGTLATRGLQPRARRGNVQPAVPGSAREERALLLHLVRAQPL